MLYKRLLNICVTAGGSLKMTPSLYWFAIVNIALSFTIFDIFDIE